jgi:hypothetical protein
MTRTNNSIVVDLNKVQFASFYYRNQYGNVRKLKPRKMTVHGALVSPFDTHVTEKIPMTKYAEKYQLVDVWMPVLRLQLTANHSLKYTGKKAISIWKEWQRRIFKRKDK